MAKIQIEKPAWLLGELEIQRKRFHNIDIEVFVGEVALDSIQGWTGNPRSELQFEQFKEKFSRNPTDDEMYKIVLNDNDTKEGHKIKELAANIYKNGVRVPIVLNYEGKLLDGNRRYYACMFLFLESAPKEEKKRFKNIPTIVLPKGASSEVESAIITEFNFGEDHFKPWSYYTKAMRLYTDYVEGMTKDEIERKYALPPRIFNVWIRAAELCEKFLAYHDNEFLARDFALRNFIMFDEMMRNYKSRLENSEFRSSVFDLLLDGYDDNNRFNSSADVIRLPELYDNPEAWEILTSRKGKTALKDAIRVLEVSAYDNTADTNSKFKRVVKGLERLVNSTTLTSADTDLLEEFHNQAERVPGAPQDPASQVEKMIEWLDNMTSLQIKQLDDDSLSSLREALERVLVMADAVSVKNG